MLCVGSSCLPKPVMLKVDPRTEAPTRCVKEKFSLLVSGALLILRCSVSFIVMKFLDTPEKKLLVPVGVEDPFSFSR